MQDSTFFIPPHLSCLSKSTHTILSSDGQPIEIWELTAPQTAELLNVWATHFRQHYCPDSEIDILREGTGLSRADYLTQIVFPDKSIAPGPGVRSGDFAELLIADYVQFVLNYWVPRGKYADKANRDESVKGVDILGFRILKESYSPEDTLLAFEVKAQASGGKYSGCLQAAIDDSSKDYLRRAITLNAIKRRLLHANKNREALTVQRFQNQSDHPYVYKSGAAALLSDEAYDEQAIQSGTTTNGHQNAQNLHILVVRGTELMKLVHALYESAANEA
ncbi:virulence associated protein [Oxalobacter vibrioformis]|uniref:Virulence associated protein n=1 Tax=Oxalobacter vibrioformis TaxID=933080 RepID=A0A9E9M022_9BURK|nr:virulence associated protein [Oxalobacter vibrioformis]WAW10368.1 virulence associated protein [Oxalobacter vibrioformis]